MASAGALVHVAGPAGSGPARPTKASKRKHMAAVGETPAVKRRKSVAALKAQKVIAQKTAAHKAATLKTAAHKAAALKTAAHKAATLKTAAQKAAAQKAATLKTAAQKAAAGRAPRALKGKAPRASPKKPPASAGSRSQEQKASVKTSSLFKNNPKIPELPRPAVQQAQEKVFTSDAFQDLALHPHLISTINTVLNMSSMTSVQKQSIPALLEGRDALVRSQTGSGKTLAYCIPVVQSLQALTVKIQRGDGPYALVLVPTRELALQSYDTVQKLLKPFTWIVPGVLMGGEKRKSEKARIRKGINILISTPGRLVDHIKSTKNIQFSRLRWLILDEADRILDMGFEKAITVILNALDAECPQRQNVLLSATLSEAVTRLADISLHDPVSISVLDESRSSTSSESGDDTDDSESQSSDELDSFVLPEGLEQHVTLVPSKLRLVCLAAFILQKCRFERDQKLIVFFSSCELVEFHYTLFVQTLLGGPEAAAPGQPPSASAPFTFLRLHGGLEQEERTAVFHEFSRSTSGVLFCTDVAARGLDLPLVTWIIQYNAPSSAAEYVHRVGRTARIGCRGSSLLVLAPSEAEYVTSLAAHRINLSEMKMEEILSVLLRGDCLRGTRWGHQHPRALGPQDIQARATVLQTVFEDYVHADEQRVSWAKQALQSFIRAYATYPRSLKHIFHVRALHLGHVAKSFGLRDAPQNLGAPAEKKWKAHVRRSSLPRKTPRNQRLSELLRSEYASGLQPATRTREPSPNPDGDDGGAGV